MEQAFNPNTEAEFGLVLFELETSLVYVGVLRQQGLLVRPYPVSSPQSPHSKRALPCP